MEEEGREPYTAAPLVMTRKGHEMVMTRKGHETWKKDAEGGAQSEQPEELVGSHPL